ncbi:MAG: PAS domain-containing protein [Anaerolineae bacterium]|nr:PAS domain-containing protein [Anaerolineae bacterium]
MKANCEFWQSILKSLKTAYAFLDASDRFVEHSPRFAQWLSPEARNLVGTPLLDVLPEFYGQEDDLAHVRQGKIPFVELEHVNRAQANGEVYYFTLMVIPYTQDAQAGLTILVTDVTQQGRYLQELTQSRNELRLLRGELFQLNEQLDFLLRHYLPSEVAEALVKGTLRPELGGELQEVSVLFADVRDFTTLAESMSPESVMPLLNEYLEIAVEAVQQYGGVVNQFQGDNLMAIFNAPQDQTDHAIRAVKASIALQEAITNHHVQHFAKNAMHFGVGINTGPAVVGNSGARWRYTYTAIGDVVNMAARITAVVPACQIWIGQATYEQLQDRVVLEPLPAITFKGKRQPTRLFRVVY